MNSRKESKKSIIRESTAKHTRCGPERHEPLSCPLEQNPQKPVRVPGLDGCFCGGFPGNMFFASDRFLNRAGQTVFLSSEAFHDFSTIFPRFVSRNTRNHHVSQCMKNGDLRSKMAAAAGVEPETCSLGESRSIQLSYATACLAVSRTVPEAPVLRTVPEARTLRPAAPGSRAAQNADNVLL